MARSQKSKLDKAITKNRTNLPSLALTPKQTAREPQKVLILKVLCSPTLTQRTTYQKPDQNMMTDEELIQKLEDLTINAPQHQMETLRSILLHNGTVRYLQPFNKGPLPLDHSTFTRLVPLSSYEDYVDHINHMAEGKDDPFLSVDPLLCFFYRLLNPSLALLFITFPNPYFVSSFISHRKS